MPCDPLGDLRAWQQRLERLSRHPADVWAPPVDVYETADAFVVTAEVPGLSREDVELAVDESRLVIKGRRKARGAAGDTVHYHQVERGHGTFERVFEFTDTIDGTRISADLSDGVLTITVPKVPPPPPRKIEVR
jgi:HSP20 family protein